MNRQVGPMGLHALMLLAVLVGWGPLSGRPRRQDRTWLSKVLILLPALACQIEV